jgi:hypothetical protein
MTRTIRVDEQHRAEVARIRRERIQKANEWRGEYADALDDAVTSRYETGESLRDAVRVLTRESLFALD